MRAIARKEDTASTLKQEQQVMCLSRSGVFIAVFDHGKWAFKERKVFRFPGSLTRFTVVKSSIRIIRFFRLPILLSYPHCFFCLALFLFFYTVISFSAHSGLLTLIAM